MKLMLDLLDKRVARVHAINTEPVSVIRERLQQDLYQWMDGLRDAGINTGRLIILTDAWQMDNGNDGPMCGGVFQASHPKYIFPYLMKA